MRNVIKQLIPVSAKGTLVCFPFAGGYSASFKPLCRYLANSQWGVLAIDPPGHGTNSSPLLENLEDMLSLYEEALAAQVSKPFVLFGHSLGGLIVYLLTQRLEKKGIPPQAVILSAVNPPDCPEENVSCLPDQEFLQYFIDLGGIPKELAEIPELLEFFLPILRADLKALEGFVHSDRTLINTPVHIFSGKSDPICPPQIVKGWNRWITSGEHHMFEGGHMFLLDHAEEVANQILSILNRKVVL